MEAAPLRRYQLFSGNALKLIAVVTMFLDHIGAGILEIPATWAALGANAQVPDALFTDPALSRVLAADMILRAIGRVAFPIFCFLLVEGFLHTRSVPRYLRRMAVFAVVTELPFDLAFSAVPMNWGYQNVFLTLLLGLLAMAALRRYGDHSLAGFLLALGCAVAAELSHADYGAFGVALILIFYLYRERPTAQTVIGCAALCWEVTAPLAFVPIRMYNGRRGKWNLKYFFYLFYPGHILLLYLVRVMLVGS